MILILIFFSILVSLTTHKFVNGTFSKLLITVLGGFSFWVLFFWGVLGNVSLNVDCSKFVVHSFRSNEALIVATGFLTPLLVFGALNFIVFVINKLK